MSIISRISAFLGLSSAARNPVQSRMRKVRGRKGKPSIKGGRFARQVIRFQQRSRYVPGQIGLSSVSTAISNYYDGDILSRSDRKRLAKSTIHPRPIFYGER